MKTKVTKPERNLEAADDENRILALIKLGNGVPRSSKKVRCPVQGRYC
jgi:hypothetical protein